MKAHKGHTKDFKDLTYAEQAKSISAGMMYLRKAVEAHIRKAKSEERDTNNVQQKCVEQIRRLLQYAEKI